LYAHNKEELMSCPLLSRLREKVALRALDAVAAGLGHGSGIDNGSADSSTKMPEDTDARQLVKPDPVHKEVPESRRSKFVKSKMCSFYLAGSCRKGGRCTFAHSQEELHPLPDRRYTKMRPKEFGTPREAAVPPRSEEVDVPSCAAASASTVDMDDLSSVFFSVKSDFEGDADSLDLDTAAAAIPWRRLHTEDPRALRERQLRVKNTFIAIEEEEDENDEAPAGKSLRKKSRPQSCPPNFRSRQNVQPLQNAEHLLNSIFSPDA